MANYKLSNDYVFFTKNGEPLQNKLNADRTVKEYHIIDDRLHDIKGQEHKLELIVEKKIIEPPKAEVKEPPKPEEQKPVEDKPENATAIEEPKSAESKPDDNKKEPVKTEGGEKNNVSILSELKKQNTAGKQDDAAKEKK